MKKVISLTAVVVFMFAVGLAYADDWPAWENPLTIQAKPDAVMVTGSAAGGHRADAVSKVDEYNNDEMPAFFRSPKATSSELQDAYLKEQAEAQKGSAAGGARAKGPNRTNEFNNDDLYSSLFRR